MSRIGRFLISEEWLVSWPNTSQWGLKRELPFSNPSQRSRERLGVQAFQDVEMLERSRWV